MDQTPAKLLSRWSKCPSTDSGKVEEEYDIFSKTYDGTLRGWQYKAPEVGAELLKEFVPVESKILDAGCGTGLTGLALKQHGFENIIGVDISGASLEVARKKEVYRELHQVDLQMPLPFRDNEFDAVECIAVLGHIEAPSLLYEFCRVVRPGGYVVFSQREDICYERNYENMLRGIEESELWRRKCVTEPMLYLPKNEDYAERIKVQYFVYEVCV